jgi:P4 family phage/plasmid primase-like protien
MTLNNGASQVKAAARGRWPTILSALHIDVPSNPKQHTPCPGCGGDDRFRFDDRDGDGTYYCNQAAKRSGDGFDLIQHVRGCDFTEALALVKDVIGQPPPSRNGTTTKHATTSPRPVQVVPFPPGVLSETLFPYDRADGTPAFYVQRVDLQDGQKVFRQWGPAEDGAGWQSNLDHVRKPKPLYRLPALLADPEAVIVLYEGETCVQAHLAAGLPGQPTTTSGGAGNAKQTDFSPLKRRQIVMCPDHDERGEHYRTETVFLSQGAGVASMKIVRFAGLPPKGDVVQWLEAGGDADAFVALIDAAEEVAPPQATEDAEPCADASLTDVGNAARLVRQHGDDLRYCKQIGWLIWDGTRWSPDDTGCVMRRAKQTARSIYQEAAKATEADLSKRLGRHADKAHAEHALKAMVSLAESEVPLRVRELDMDPFLLNTPTGTIDLRTGKRLPHSRAHFITRLTSVGFDPDARAPTWEACLDCILQGNGELIAWLQRALGYSLTGDVSEQALFIPHGCGANGKTTLIETFARVLGDYAANTRAETLMAKKGDGIPNDVAALRGARFVYATESDHGKRLAESLIKQLTGGDCVTARFMRQDFFQFHPTFKIFLSTNHRPRIRGTDAAIWRRIRLIPFAVTIPDAERDRHLKEKLLAEGEGILAWAVRGCLAWQRDGLGAPAVVEQATLEYRTDEDDLGGFLRDRCVVAPDARVTKHDLFEVYVEWAKDAGERDPYSMRQLTGRLKDRGFAEGYVDRAKGWHGLRLRTAADGEGLPEASPSSEAASSPPEETLYEYDIDLDS